MSEAKEPKVHSLAVRRPFHLNGKEFKRGEVFCALIVNCFVHDSIEMASLQIGDAKPNAVPWDYIAFKE